MLGSDHEIILRELVKTGRCPLILEEVAATASLSFERAWYAVLDLIEARFISPSGIGLYDLTEEGKETARRLIAN